MDNRPYQVRVFLKQEFAEAVRSKATPEEMKPIMAVLERHNASFDHNQFDEFSGFVAWAEANIDKTAFPDEDKKQQMQKLLALTKNSLANEEKASYFKREFTLSVGNKSQFTGSEADALIADLEALNDGSIMTGGKGFVPGHNFDVAAVRKTYVPKRHPGT